MPLLISTSTADVGAGVGINSFATAEFYSSQLLFNAATKEGGGFSARGGSHLRLFHTNIT